MTQLEFNFPSLEQPKKDRVSHDVAVLMLASKVFGEIEGNDDDFVGMHDFMY